MERVVDRQDMCLFICLFPLLCRTTESVNKKGINKKGMKETGAPRRVRVL